MGTSNEIELRRMPPNTFGDRSVMACQLVSQLGISCVNVDPDLWHHMVSLGNNELTCLLV